MNTTLVSFLIRAKKATSVGGGAKARASRTASHDLTFRLRQVTVTVHKTTLPPLGEGGRRPDEG